VNASFATHFFGGPQAALGRTISRDTKKESSDYLIVGVVGDTKHAGVRAPVDRTVYRSLYQSTEPNFITFVVRSSQPPQTMQNSIRVAMQQLDSKLALGHIRTMDELVADNLSSERIIALLSISFGVLAVLLAAIGIYGVLAYSTAQRTREIGIRMALGAQRTGVVRLILSDVLRMAAIAVAVTLPLSLVLARMIRSQLYGVNSFDWLSLLGGVFVVAFVVLLSAMLPARQAASVEPMKALRTE